MRPRERQDFLALWRQVDGRTALILLLIVLAAILVSPVAAQTYSFEVPELQLQVFALPDGSARLVYDITFQNLPAGDWIDIVDIGLPHGDYSISNMTASVAGVPLGDIRPSEFVTPGVEVHLEAQSIPPGQSGTLHFEATLPDLVFQDVTSRDLASLQMTPTWFDSSAVQGNTNLQIAIHIPEGIGPEEVLYQDEPFTDKAIFQDHVVALWQYPSTQLTGPHLVGVSFPLRGASKVVPMSALDLASIWFENNTTLRWILGIVAVVLLGILYLRFTGGTGITLWLLLSAGMIYLFVTAPASQLLVFFGLTPLIVLNERRLRTRKTAYLPPVAQVEGGGIKRGLTAPEAAALLEMPINKVLTLIIFGLLKKAVLLQIKETPLVVKVATPFDTSEEKSDAKQRYDLRRRAGQANGVALHQYEQRFLDAIEASPQTPVHEIDFGPAMRWFLENVARRLKGFDLSDTQDYYRSIVERAVEQASALGEIPEKEKAVDRDLEWILIDDRYPTVLDTPIFHYRPIWVRTSSSSSGGPSISPSSSGGGPSGGAPRFGDVAAGFAGWTENTMASMASAIMPGSLEVPGTRGGVIDLSGVDRTAGNIFEALTSNGGSSRSGGSGCACACAGCACACACAGGGR